MFTLHPQLAKDCIMLGTLPLSHVLLMNNAAFPWVILVPARANVREITDLLPEDRQQLMEEIANASLHMQTELMAEKMNVAALGNQVPQLHVHVIARFAADRAWPNPVWGQGGAPYEKDAGEALVVRLAEAFQSINGFRPVA